MHFSWNTINLFKHKSQSYFYNEMNITAFTAKQPLHQQQGAACLLILLRENSSLSIHDQLETDMGLDTALETL